MGLSKIAEGCAKCPFFDTCDHKEMEMLEYLPEPVMASATADVTQPLAAPLIVKHDYRNVKVAENTVVTIDLEELKKDMERKIWEDAMRGYLKGGC